MEVWSGSRILGQLRITNWEPWLLVIIFWEEQISLQNSLFYFMRSLCLWILIVGFFCFEACRRRDYYFWLGVGNHLVLLLFRIMQPIFTIIYLFSLWFLCGGGWTIPFISLITVLSVFLDFFDAWLWLLICFNGKPPHVFLPFFIRFLSCYCGRRFCAFPPLRIHSSALYLRSLGYGGLIYSPSCRPYLILALFYFDRSYLFLDDGFKRLWNCYEIIRTFYFMSYPPFLFLLKHTQTEYENAHVMLHSLQEWN